MRSFQTSILAALCLTSAGIITGCANGTQSVPSTTQRGLESVPVRFNIVIPRAAKSKGRSPLYISSSTQSASITVNTATPIVVNCTATCSATVQAPLGSDTFAVQLYDGPNATGAILSQGSTVSTIVQNTSNVVSVSFAGVIKTLALSTSGTVTRGIASSVALSVVAQDWDGNTIIGNYYNPITLSNLDTSGATTLSQTSVSASSAQITVAYNGANSYSGSTITAAASGGASSTTAIPNPCAAIPGVPAAAYPCDFQYAYNIPTRTGGAGQTIAIVDAYDDPSAESDLAVYRGTFGLPACTTANGCFRKVNQAGGTTYPAPNNSWAGEISLDVDMASAVCPNCHILLVEANSSLASDLYPSINTAASLGATEISASFGTSEYSGETSDDLTYFNHPGVPITVSSGDGAYAGGTQYPAASRFVTAVGGTALYSASNARGFSETAWDTDATNGAGSGCSAFEPKPTWQSDLGCAKRMVADVSAMADPNNPGAVVYDSYNASGWQVIGGTSAAAPIIAAIYALAGNAASLNYGSYPYLHPSGLFDVTSGSTGSCSPSYFCTAGPGYDGPTGLGTPNGTGGLGAFTASAPLGGVNGANDRITNSIRSAQTERLCSTPPPGSMACHAVFRTDVGKIAGLHS